jgi:Ca-activated chloride channel family protein
MNQTGDGQALDTDLVPDASRITPPVLLPGFPNPVQLAVDVTIDDGGLGFGSAHCNLPCSAVEEPGGRLHLRLDPGQRLDRDLLVRIPTGGMAGGAEGGNGLRAGALYQPDALAGDSGDARGQTGTLSVWVIPPSLPEAALPRDVVFLLDRSGSMGGWKIAAARSAAARLVESLDARDRFRVIAFDTSADEPTECGGALIPATDANRYRAARWLRGIEARGGTELAQPLQAAAECLAEAAREHGRERSIVAVTDGQVGNEDHLLRLLAKTPHQARVFTVGIDTAVNAGFLERLAQSHGGSCALVQSEDRLSQVIDGVRQRIGRPAFTGARLEPGAGWPCDLERCAPGRHGDAFPGKPWTVLARCSEPAPGARIRLRAGSPDGRPIDLEIPVARAHDAPLAPLWVRWRLRDLEDAYAAEPGDRSTLEREIVQVSLAHRVLSRFTAWVAVDESEVVAGTATPSRIVQPVDLPSGWETRSLERGFGSLAASDGGERRRLFLCIEDSELPAMPMPCGQSSSRPAMAPSPGTGSLSDTLDRMVAELDSARDGDLAYLLRGWFHRSWGLRRGAALLLHRNLARHGAHDDALDRLIADLKKALDENAPPARLRTLAVELLAAFRRVFRASMRL